MNELWTPHFKINPRNFKMFSDNIFAFLTVINFTLRYVESIRSKYARNSAKTKRVFSKRDVKEVRSEKNKITSPNVLQSKP